MKITDPTTRRIRQALARLAQARGYQQQAARLVLDAEASLRTAVEAAQRLKRKPV